MELQWIRENMETEQILSTRPTQAVVETEVALPGGLREEARVYYADAAVSVNGGEMTGSRVMTDGKVMFHVLYAQGDLSKIAALETAVDFHQALPLKEENIQPAAAHIHPRAQVQHVSAKAFNGRLLLQAIILFTAEISLPRNLSFIRDVEENENIQRATQALAMQRAVGEGEGVTLLKEEFALSDVLQIQDTLYATAQARVEDILGGADGRATAVGKVEIEAYHTADMPGRPLVYTRHTVPFEHTVNLSGALGDALIARSTVRDVAVLSREGAEQGKIMRAEVQLQTEITAVENREMTVLKDVFTLSGPDVAKHSQRVFYRGDTVNEEAAESGKTVIQLPEGAPRMKQLLLAFARPIPVKTERQSGRLIAEGILEISLIYLTEDSDIPVSIQQEEPFRTVFATRAEAEDQLLLTACQVEGSAVTGDRAEIKYILHLSAEGVRRAEAEIITDAEEAPAQERPRGISLYFIQPGDTAWEIARRYRIPLSAIGEMNPDFSEDAAPGTPVIICRQ